MSKYLRDSWLGSTDNFGVLSIVYCHGCPCTPLLSLKCWFVGSASTTLAGWRANLGVTLVANERTLYVPLQWISNLNQFHPISICNRLLLCLRQSINLLRKECVSAESRQRSVSVTEIDLLGAPQFGCRTRPCYFGSLLSWVLHLFWEPKDFVKSPAWPIYKRLCKPATGSAQYQHHSRLKWNSWLFFTYPYLSKDFELWKIHHCRLQICFA